MIKLNKEQEEAVDKMVKFIEGNSDLPYFTLSGGGGTGKTTVMKYVLENTSKYQFDRSAAAVAHAAKNVICDSLENSIPCYTVAQWLGLKMTYGHDGEIYFTQKKKSMPKLTYSKIAILDEVSMINDDLYNQIMQIVRDHNLKLITLGDKFQLPPVKQDHDSKFFDDIHAELVQPMRFTGCIYDLGQAYRNEIKNINNGYVGNPRILDKLFHREDKTDSMSSYNFSNNIYKLIEQVGYEIKSSEAINESRMLAYKNDTVRLLNKEVRKYIYGDNAEQFEIGEILISNGGYRYNNMPVLNNGQIVKVHFMNNGLGPYDIPCVFLKFDNNPFSTAVPAVQDTPTAKAKYESLKEKLKNNALRDNTQWPDYYRFIESFAYMDYAYSVTVHKAQGQTIDNVYIMEGEIMRLKPLKLKHKLQSLYVAVTRARKNVYIYNKDK